MALEYIETANEMNSILLQGFIFGHRPFEQLIMVAEHGCNTLEKVLHDTAFRQYVDDLVGLYNTQKTNIDLSTGKEQAEKGQTEESLNRFIVLLRFEGNLLAENGMSPELTNQLLFQVELLTEQVRDFKADRDALFNLIRQVRDQACTLAGDLRQRRRREGIIARIWHITYAVAGVGVIAVNAISIPALLAAGPLGLAVAPASLAIGGVLIDRAVPERKAL